jgi:hypothetical protein
MGFGPTSAARHPPPPPMLWKKEIEREGNTPNINNNTVIFKCVTMYVSL